jgi:hypothetical protein
MAPVVTAAPVNTSTAAPGITSSTSFSFSPIQALVPGLSSTPVR